MSRKPRLLDLFCGAGGASVGYYKAGFDVVGVDIKPQPHYPFEFAELDAIEAMTALFLTNWGNYYYSTEFDAIHASPPCQAFTKKHATWGRKRTYQYNHGDWLTPTREKFERNGKPYIIENVNGSPLRGTLMLCGTMFGLKIIRHRFFEFNWDMPIMTPTTCNHKDVYNPWSGDGRSADKMREAMGIDWMPTSGGASRKAGYTGDLYNAIPPAYTEYIGGYLIKHIIR